MLILMEGEMYDGANDHDLDNMAIFNTRYTRRDRSISRQRGISSLRQFSRFVRMSNQRSRFRNVMHRGVKKFSR